MKNKLWGLPDNYGKNLLFFYNKDLVSKQPKTVVDLLKLTKGKSYPVVFDINEPHYVIPFILSYYDEQFSDLNNFTIREMPFIKVVKLLRKFNTAGPKKLSDLSYSDAKILFKDKKAVAIIDGEWMLDEYRGVIQNLGIIKQLTKKEKLRSFASTKCYSVFQDSDADIEAIKKFIIFMTSKDSQLRWLKLKRLPSHKDVSAQTIKERDKLLYAGYNILLNCKGKPNALFLKSFYSNLRPKLEAMNREEISEYAFINDLIKYYSTKETLE